MKRKTIKLRKAVNYAGMNIPAGTMLKFGTEGYAPFRGRKIPSSLFPGLESDDSEDCKENGTEGANEVAETVIDMLRNKYPDGFTANQLSEDFEDKIDGSIYTLNDSESEDADAVLSLSVDENTEIKIYLAKDETDTYTLTGKFDASEVAEECDEQDVAPAVEAFIGRLALATRTGKKRKTIASFRRK